MSKVFIIAEAGVNHNGDIELAKQLIDVAAEAGADAVKFQTFISSGVASSIAPKAEYQKALTRNDESQLEMLKKLELSYGDHEQLRSRCIERNIQFLSSAGDMDSLDFLLDFGIPFLKIASGEITNLPYLRKAGASGLPIVISTGMSDMGEIGAAVSILTASGTPAKQITLLHCNTQYPTPFGDVNLNAMATLANEFGMAVGYSDHTLGIEAPIAAVALGATVIEKHFTLDKQMDGPDHKASLDPQELRAMVSAIRNTEVALGHADKGPTGSEFENRSIARRSIVAARGIKKGEVFSELNLTVKRPGTGRSPMEWDEVIGTHAERDYGVDEAI